MNPFELKEAIEAKPFEPFVVVTSAGDRYEVRHPEMARLADNGTLFIFEKPSQDWGHFSRFTRVAFVNITALEPSPQKAA